MDCVPDSMGPLRHRRFRDEVQLFFDDALEDQRIPGVLAHLADCDGCRDDLRWWSDLRVALQSSATYEIAASTSAAGG